MANLIFCVDEEFKLTGASSLLITGKSRLVTLDYTVPTGAVGSSPIGATGTASSLQCVAFGQKATGTTKIGVVYILTIDGSNMFVYDNHGDLEGFKEGGRITTIALLDAPGVLKYENGAPFIRYTGTL